MVSRTILPRTSLEDHKPASSVLFDALSLEGCSRPPVRRRQKASKQEKMRQPRSPLDSDLQCSHVLLKTGVATPSAQRQDGNGSGDGQGLERGGNSYSLPPEHLVPIPGNTGYSTRIPVFLLTEGVLQDARKASELTDEQCDSFSSTARGSNWESEADSD